MQEGNKQAGHSIVHVQDQYSALAHLKAGLPKLLISDLSFYQRPGDSTPDPKNGYKLLQEFTALCRKSDKAPLVWIVTGDERDGVIAELENNGVLGGDYKVAPLEGGDEYLTKNGIISILDNTKDLSERPDLLMLVSGLLGAVGYPQQVSTNSDIAPIERQLTVQRISLSSNFPKNLSAYLKTALVDNPQPDSAFIVVANPQNSESLEKSLGRWFASPKIPDHHDYDPDFIYPI